MSEFNISCSWLSGQDCADTERTTLADLVIRVNGMDITESEDLFAMTVRSGARLSAYPLALWAASNWWRLRWEPSRDTTDWKLSHCIASAGSGYAWPDICFSSDGERVRITSSALHSKEMSVRYLCNHSNIIPASQFEAGLDTFMEMVLARTENVGREHNLKTLWQDVMEERNSPRMTAWRKLEALMGCDPDDADESLMNQLSAMSHTYGVGSIEELAAYGVQQTPAIIEELLERATKTENASIYKWDKLKEQLAGKRELRPWQLARETASVVRETWGLNSTEVIPNEALADLLSLSAAHIESGSPNTLPGLGVRAENKGTFSPLLSKRYITSRRFELARLTGDMIMADETDRLLPATNLKTARQKFQRAFAQELLCPYTALISFFSGASSMEDEAIEEVAQQYQVSPLLVKTTLVNHGHLEREELEMDYIA